MTTQRIQPFHWALCLAVACAAGGSGRAEEPEPISTDRPDFTETASAVPVGRMQLETGYTYARRDDSEAHSLGEALLRIAAGPGSEVRVGFGSYALARGASRSSGFEDLSLGFKVELARASRSVGFGRPDIALIGETSVPSGSRAFREDKWQPGAKLCLGWSPTERTGLGVNLNVASASDGGDRFTEYSGSLSVGYGLSQRTTAFAECFLIEPQGAGRRSETYVNGGVTYLMKADYQLDMRVGFGLNGERPDHFLGAGASWQW